jgi:hypothetical protein
MEVPTVFIVVVAFVVSLIVNAVLQRRFLAAGQSLFRSSIKSGLLGFLTAIAIVAVYLAAGHLIWRIAA